VLFSTEIIDIEKTEVYQGGIDPITNSPLYHLYLYTRKSGDYAIESSQFALIDKTFSILFQEKARWKKKPKKKGKKLLESSMAAVS
jgi:hypothetical protein